MGTKSGAFINSFAIWKAMPTQRDNEKLKLANLFERKLSKFLLGSLKQAYDPLKDLNYEALSQKRMAIRKLLEKSMSS